MKRRRRRNGSVVDTVFVDYLLERREADDQDYERLGGGPSEAGWGIGVGPGGEFLYDYFVPEDILDELRLRGLTLLPGGDFVAARDWSRFYTTWDNMVPNNFSDLDKRVEGKSARSRYKPSELWLVPELAAGSDHSGGIANRSNLEVLSEIARDGEMFKKNLARVLAGGYGSYGIAIRGDVNYGAMLEALESLEDYPILDQHHYEGEVQGAIDEAYPDVVGEFAELLQRRFPTLDPDHPNYSEVVEALFNALDPQWEEEPGGNFHVNAHQLMQGWTSLPEELQARFRSLMAPMSNPRRSRSARPSSKRKLMR